MSKRCLKCNKEFSTKNKQQKFCSHICYSKSLSLSGGEILYKKCDFCAKRFNNRKNGGNCLFINKLFCSRYCSVQNKVKKSKEKRILLTKVCQRCLVPFSNTNDLSIGNFKKKKFCSNKCIHLKKILEKKCKFCNEVFNNLYLNLPTFQKRQFCSNVCSQKYTLEDRKKKIRNTFNNIYYSSYLKPEKIQSLYKHIRECYEYKEWRIQIIKRDNNTCRKCNVFMSNPQVDHIIPFYLILKENKVKSFMEALKCKVLWDINNGRVLCAPCHRKTDTYGYKAISFNLIPTI